MTYLRIIIVVAFLMASVQSIEPDMQLCSSVGNEKGACECENRSSSPWGTKIINVDCQFKRLTFTTFNWEILPPLIETLDISWNYFQYVPNLDSTYLKRLVVSHNNVTALDDNNFAKVTNLQNLDLSWNSIEIVSANAFYDLQYLETLDLSHNNLKKISFNVFSALVSLDDLNMSWNTNLNETFAVKDVDLFLDLGVTPKLKTLELGHCGLSYLDIVHGTNITYVNLEWNNLIAIPSLPRGIKRLDMSGNPIEVMGSAFLPNMYQLEALLMEDMPILREVNAYALQALPALKKLSFQNSRRLEKFSPEAFGSNQNETALEELNLRGAALDTLNASLAGVFQKLKTIELSGLPLDCDCRILWIKHLGVETGAQCVQPKILNGVRVSSMAFSETECQHWPGWIIHTVQGLLLVVFLVLCSVGFYMLVVRLRPRSGAGKIGPTSPYAPITIQPNRAENHF